MATKLGRMVTYLDNLDNLLPIKSNNLIITWICETRDKLKTFYLHYHNAYDHKTWQGDDLT